MRNYGNCLRTTDVLVGLNTVLMKRPTGTSVVRKQLRIFVIIYHETHEMHENMDIFGMNREIVFVCFVMAAK